MKPIYFVVRDALNRAKLKLTDDARSELERCLELEIKEAGYRYTSKEKPRAVIGRKEK